MNIEVPQASPLRYSPHLTLDNFVWLDGRSAIARIVGSALVSTLVWPRRRKDEEERHHQGYDTGRTQPMAGCKNSEATQSTPVPARILLLVFCSALRFPTH